MTIEQAKFDQKKMSSRTNECTTNKRKTRWRNVKTVSSTYGYQSVQPRLLYCSFLYSVVKLNPQPWLRKWERYTEIFQGYETTDPFCTPGKIRRQMRCFLNFINLWIPGIQDVYPGSWFLSIPDPRSRIPEPTTATKEGEKISCPTFL